jgi:hypothetical protein
MNYYEPEAYTPRLLAQHVVGDFTAELLETDIDGEYFCANVYRVDSEGLVDYQNNSGHVSYAEAFQTFVWDLDCFLDGAEFADSMFTAEYHRLYPAGLPRA